MTELTLEVTERAQRGSSAMGKMRRDGMIPGIIYGVKEPLAIQMEQPRTARLVHQLRGSERMISLHLVDGQGKVQETRQVIMKEVQTRFPGSQLLHIDFREVDITKPVRVSVEVRPVGTAEGIKHGGILQSLMYEVEIECLPTAIPENIPVDVSAMKIGDSIHLRDLVFPPGIKPITPPDETVLVIAGATKEVVEEEAVAAPAPVEEKAEPAEEAAGSES